MKITKEQQSTIDTFSRLDDHVYLLSYQNEYGLDTLLREGVSSTRGLLKFVIREMRKQRKGSFACSAFEAFTKDNQHLMGRNFDYMDAPLLVVWTQPKAGYKSLSVANCTFMLYGKKSMHPMKQRSKKRLLMAPYCCMDGINEKGLAIAVLEIKTKATHQQNGKRPLTTTTVIRTVLDKCATVDEAVKVFEDCAMHDAIFCNYHFHITDNNGDCVIIEYVNNKISVLRKEKVLTNYFLTEGGDNQKGFGYERHDYICDILQLKKNVLSEEESMRVLENCHLNYKHKRGYQIITLWSSVYNSFEKTMTMCAGLNYDAVYKFDVNKPGEVIKETKKETYLPCFEFKHIDKEMV